MHKISVIIPVYNVEPYIRKCLDSVINQTYENLEILLIDDGSTDESGRICDEYAVKDSRIIVYHKENGGLSSALNIGLNNFTGEYLGFVDSDDWIEPDMYHALIGAINGVDISVCSYYKDTFDTTQRIQNAKKITDSIISSENMLLYPLMRDYYMGYCGYIWNKLYTTELINKSELFFDEKIKYAMDVLFYETLVSKTGCIGAYIDKPLYHYLQRSGAITKSESFNIKTDILDVYKRVEALLPNEYKYWARGFYCYHASVIYELAIKKSDMKMLSKMQEAIRVHFKDYELTNIDFPDKINRMARFLPDESCSTVESVYESIQDDISRRIFTARFLYYLSGDKHHMDAMLWDINKAASINEFKTIFDFLEDDTAHSHDVILYGAGVIGTIAFQMLNEKSIFPIAFCDSSTIRQGGTLLGAPIISPDDLIENHAGAIVIITTGQFNNEIKKYLEEIGFNQNQIYLPGNYKEQYFYEDFLRPVNNEVYIDVGCFDGHTIMQFIDFCNNDYALIYGLEPDSVNFKNTSINTKNIPNLQLLNKGAWSKVTSLSFDASSSDGSRITNSGTIIIDTITIDDLVKDDIVTLIKMDIEGAELDALHGASKTIMRNKPRLIICIYHKNEDIVKIPAYIKSIVPEYRLFIRHHGLGYPYVGTVLYALP